MIELSRADLATVVRGAVRDAQNSERLGFHGVQFDSREIQGGELFVALKGEVSHGHDFVDKALERGASLCLVEDRRFLERPDGDRFVVVSDSLAAMQTLATWWRRELKIPVLAITGSAGKTTVKEMAAAILLKHSRGVFSLKSHNNHVGVPYTILRASRDHRWAVLEMGMNHGGELTQLSKIGEPDVALITMIGPAHIEHLGSLEAIAQAKLEIRAGLPSHLPLIINNDDPILKQGLAITPSAHPLRRFGAGSDSDTWVDEVRTCGLDGVKFNLSMRDPGAPTARTFPITLATFGKHNALNGAAAALGAKTLIPDLTDEQIIEGLSSFRAPLMRLNLKSLGDGRKVVDDSYNANPASMLSLLSVVAELTAEGKKVGLILGDMLELGEFSEGYHREVGTAVVKAAPGFLIGVGPHSKFYLEEAKKGGIPVYHADNPEVAALMALKSPFEVLLVKGSRGIGLERAVQQIEERAG